MCTVTDVKRFETTWQRKRAPIRKSCQPSSMILYWHEFLGDNYSVVVHVTFRGYLDNDERCSERVNGRPKKQNCDNLPNGK